MSPTIDFFRVGPPSNPGDTVFQLTEPYDGVVTASIEGAEYGDDVVVEGKVVHRKGDPYPETWVRMNGGTRFVIASVQVTKLSFDDGTEWTPPAS